jgi:hypothetical protein
MNSVPAASQPTPLLGAKSGRFPIAAPCAAAGTTPAAAPAQRRPATTPLASVHFIFALDANADIRVLPFSRCIFAVYFVMRLPPMIAGNAIMRCPRKEDQATRAKQMRTISRVVPLDRLRLKNPPAALRTCFTASTGHEILDNCGFP